jgi:N-acetylglucosaminyldiphosphoundecaprenol N-acetyl-beta-D-mannosaminyltransferase
VPLCIQDAHPTLRLTSSKRLLQASRDGERVDAVRNSGAKILFVAMGVPRQEQFIEENWNDLGVSVAIGVGGSFDVIAGIRRRAPVWAQKAGMEWFFRLVQEPGRLAKRYLVTNSSFI